MKADKRMGLGLVAVLLLLAGCGGAPAGTVRSETVVAPQTVIVRETVVVPVPQTVIVPQTVVVTATPLPTSTRRATSGRQWSAGDVIGAFVAYHLIDGVGVRALTKDDYGLAPYVGSGLRFRLPALCADCGGRVFTFESAADRDAVRAYYEGMGRQSAALFSWVFVRDNVLVQINGDLPEAQARQFEAVLQGL